MQAIASAGGGVVITPADLVIPIPTVSAVASTISPGALGGAIADDGGVQTNETTPANEAAVAVRESYNAGDDGNKNISSTDREAQTFTPSNTHTFDSVKLKLYRVGTPGTCYVNIKAVDGSGHPYGSALASGTFDGDVLTVDPLGAWYEVTLTPIAAGKSGTQYAIVVWSTNTGLRWLCDTTSPTYSGGRREYSTDSGATWNSDSTVDFMFEEWGKLCDMTLTPAVPVVNDAYYFGLSTLWDWLSLNIGQNGQGTWTIAWEYWNGGAWATLPNAYDTSVGFHNVGSQSVAFPRPSDWALLTILGLNLYWIRARVSAFTNMPTQPLGTQAWIGVH